MPSVLLHKSPACNYTIFPPTILIQHAVPDAVLLLHLQIPAHPNSSFHPPLYLRNNF